MSTQNLKSYQLLPTTEVINEVREFAPEMAKILMGTGAETMTVERSVTLQDEYNRKVRGFWAQAYERMGAGAQRRFLWVMGSAIGAEEMHSFVYNLTLNTSVSTVRAMDVEIEATKGRAALLEAENAALVRKLAEAENRYEQLKYVIASALDKA